MAALYDQLYLTAAVTLHAFYYGLTFSRHLRTEEHEVVFISVCRRHEVLPSNHPYQDVIVIVGVILAALTPSWSLYYAARRFVSRRSEGNLPPAIFGRYRRNVVSYNETVFYNIIVVAISMSLIALVIVFHTVIVVYIQVSMYFVITLVIAVKAFKDPFLFRPKSKIIPHNEGSVFYVRPPDIVPRRDYVYVPPPAPVTGLHRNIIFVRPAKNREA